MYLLLFLMVKTTHERLLVAIDQLAVGFKSCSGRNGAGSKVGYGGHGVAGKMWSAGNRLWYLETRRGNGSAGGGRRWLRADIVQSRHNIILFVRDRLWCRRVIVVVRSGKFHFCDTSFVLLVGLGVGPKR